MTLKENLICLAGSAVGGLLAALLAYFTTPGVLLSEILGGTGALLGYSIAATIMIVTWDRRHRH
jgi:hypothetical protein